MQPYAPARFLGVDWHQLHRDWIVALNLMAHWPAFRWLTPAHIVRIKTQSGKSFDYIEKAGRVVAVFPQAKTVKFSGFLLPDKLVLWQSVALPNLSADAVRAAIELQVRDLNPFSPDDAIWGYIPSVPMQGRSKTYIAIASRKLIAQYVASLESAQSSQKNFEIWVEAPESYGFLVLDGFGEKMRMQYSSRWRGANLCLVFLLIAIGFAAAITPAAQLRLRAVQAFADFTKLQSLAAPVLQVRERLVRLEQQVKALQAPIEQSLQPELVLLNITKLLGDDTYVTSLQAQGAKISLSGQTPNTAALMQQLGSQVGVKDVRAPSPATKQRGAERETFNIEFMLDSSRQVARP